MRRYIGLTPNDPRSVGRREGGGSGADSRPGVLTRRNFLELTVAAAGAQLLGGAEIARIAPSRQSLLDGARTVVPEHFNWISGANGQPEYFSISSAITAVKFHSGVVVGKSAIDGSPQYIPSYAPGGLVDSPVGVGKTVNGVQFTEYCGELSGYEMRGDLNGNETLFGPIDEYGVDHNKMTQQLTYNGYPVFYNNDFGFKQYFDTSEEDQPTSLKFAEPFTDQSTGTTYNPGDPVPSTLYGYDAVLTDAWTYPAQATPVDETYNRFGLAGVSFHLRIPENWNGTLKALAVTEDTMMTPFQSHFDEIYLLVQGYATVEMNACYGVESGTDSNYNNDEWWKNLVENDVYYYDWPHNLWLNKPLHTKWNAVLLDYVPPTGPGQWAMFFRDSMAVYKNIVKAVTGRDVKLAYYGGESFLGGTGGQIKTGSGYGIFTGGDYVKPYANSPYCADGSNNPNFDPSDPNPKKVFDGFIANSPANSEQYFDPQTNLPVGAPWVPYSDAPFMSGTGESDISGTHFEGLMMAYMENLGAHANSTMTKYWPYDGDPTRSQFVYSFEHFSHWTDETQPTMFAVAYNGSGLYVTQDGVFNTGGNGRELSYLWAKRYYATLYYGYGSQLEQLQVYIWPVIWMYSATMGAGVYHQLITNLHQYLTKGVLPPPSTLDPYWTNHNIFPKFPTVPNWIDYYTYPTDPTFPKTQDAYVTEYSPGYDISIYQRPMSPSGVIRTAIDAILHGHILNLETAIYRLPDDAARLGLYMTDGYEEPVYQAFTQSELMNGFSPNNPSRPLDWDGSPLVTLVMADGRRIPQDGYKNHNEYVAAVKQATAALVGKRLFDPYIASIYGQRAEQSDIPVTLKGQLAERSDVAVPLNEHRAAKYLNGKRHLSDRMEWLIRRHNHQ